MDFSPVAVLGGSLAAIGGLLDPKELLHRLDILNYRCRNSLLAELGKLNQLRAVGKVKFAEQLRRSIAMG